MSATDPRILKQLLLAQWSRNVSPLDPSSATGDSLFETLLGGLLESPGSNSSWSPLAAMPSLSGYGLSSDMWGLASSSSSIFGMLGSSGPWGVLAPGWEADRESDGYGGSAAAYEGLIQAAAVKYGIHPALIKGVIQTESGFRPGALSPAGAKGLMQLMDETARTLGVQDVWDPAQNIDGGSRFLSYLLRKYDGNVSSALAAYNAGPGRVDRLGLVNDRLVSERLGELPEETRNYIRKVLEAARQFGMPI
jgi:hypothetical protein